MERHFANYVSQTVDQQITDIGFVVGNLFDILCCPQGSLGLDRIDDAVREHVASNFCVQIYDMDIRFCRDRHLDHWNFSGPVRFDVISEFTKAKLNH